jgi:hypothetical protein
MKKETLQVRGLKLFSSVFASLMGILAFSLSAQAQSTKNYATVAVMAQAKRSTFPILPTLPMETNLLLQH